MIDFSVQRYAFLALASAALFGAAAPALKPIAGILHPVLLAGLLYLGSFLGLAVARAIRGPAQREAALGGLAAPVLLVWGLPASASRSPRFSPRHSRSPRPARGWS